MDLRRVAFIYFSFLPFIQQDYEILSKHFAVERVHFQGIGDIIKIVTSVRRTDVSYTWFADACAFFAVVSSKIFGKTSVVVVGGYDVANEPEIGYGMCAKNIIRRWMTKVVLKCADHVLPVSEFTQRETEKFASGNVKMVYNGVNTTKFVPSTDVRNTVLTVGSKIKLKGIDVFVAVAHHMPSKTFVIVGMSEDSIADLEMYCTIPDNLVVVGNVSHDNMVDYYQRAKVYCQLSYRESFGMALAEAMACGCIPVVADRGAMSEVVGNDGIYVPYGDVDATVFGIDEAFISTDLRPRNRIDTNFNASHREAALNDIIIHKLINRREQ